MFYSYAYRLPVNKCFCISMYIMYIVLQVDVHYLHVNA